MFLETRHVYQIIVCDQLVVGLAGVYDSGSVILTERHGRCRRHIASAATAGSPLLMPLGQKINVSVLFALTSA